MKIPRPSALLGAGAMGLLVAGSSVPASEASVASSRGAEVYLRYCALCHGASGKGDGRAAALQKTRPADLTTSRITRDEKLAIVRHGGAALKRSSSMPAWSEVLSEQDIADVMAHLDSMVSSTISASASRSDNGNALSGTGTK